MINNKGGQFIIFEINILLFFQLLARDSNKRSSSASKEKGNIPRRLCWLAQPKKVSSYHQFCIIHKLWKTAKSGNSKKKKKLNLYPYCCKKVLIYDCFGLPPININDLVPPSENSCCLLQPRVIDAFYNYLLPCYNKILKVFQ